MQRPGRDARRGNNSRGGSGGGGGGGGAGGSAFPGFPDPFAGFGGRPGFVSDMFENDPFSSDPFFTRPFGSLFGNSGSLFGPSGLFSQDLFPHSGNHQANGSQRQIPIKHRPSNAPPVSTFHLQIFRLILPCRPAIVHEVVKSARQFSEVLFCNM